LKGIEILKSYRNYITRLSTYSIRKYSVGVLSVMIGASLLVAPTVLADQIESVDAPRETVEIPRESVDIPRESVDVPRESIEESPRESVDIPRESVDVPHESVDTPRESIEESPRESVDIPRESINESHRENVEMPRESVGEPTPNIDDRHEPLGRNDEYGMYGPQHRPADAADDSVNVPDHKLPEDNRPPVVENEYIHANRYPHEYQVDGPSKATDLAQTDKIYYTHANAVAKAKEAGYTLSYTEKRVSPDDISRVYYESQDEADRIRVAISNNRRQLRETKDENKKKLAKYEAEKAIYEKSKADYDAASKEDLNRLSDIRSNNGLVSGQYGEPKAKLAITGTKFLTEEAINNREQSWRTHIDPDQTNNITDTDVTDTHPNYQPNGYTSTFNYNILAKVGDTVEATYTNLQDTYLTTTDGQKVKVAKIVKSYTINGSSDSTGKVLGVLSSNPIHDAEFKASTDTTNAIDITTKVRYYDANGQELTSDKVYYGLTNLRHSTSERTIDGKYKPKGITIAHDVEETYDFGYKTRRKIITTTFKPDNRADSEIITPQGQDERFSLYHNVTGKDSNGLPIGDLISGPNSKMEDGIQRINEVDDNGVIRGYYTFDAENNRIFYTPIEEVVNIDRVHKVQVQNEDTVVNVPGSSITNNNGTLYAQNDNVYTDAGSRYNANSDDQLGTNGWSNYGGNNYYGMAVVNSKSHTFRHTMSANVQGRATTLTIATGTYIPEITEPTAPETPELEAAPTIEVTRWIGVVPVKKLTKTEYTHTVFYTNEQGDDIAPAKKLAYTLLDVYALEDSQDPSAEPTPTYTKYKIESLLTKEEEEELFQNFNQTGELMFHRNGEEIHAERQSDLFKYPKDYADEKFDVHGILTKPLTHAKVNGYTPTYGKDYYQYSYDDGRWDYTKVLSGDALKEIGSHWLGVDPTQPPRESLYEGPVRNYTHIIYRRAAQQESTRFVTVQSGQEVEISPTLEGTHDAPTILEFASMEYQYTGETKVENGITTHYYTLVVSEVPTDAPSHGEEKPLTRFVTVQNETEVEIADTVEGTVSAPTFVQGEKYFYNGTTTVADGITTHYYDLVTGEKPTNAPNVGVDKVVTRFVTLKDGNEVDVAEALEGTHAAPKFLQNEKYVYNTTNSHDSIITHYYDLVVSEKPSDAPSVPELPEFHQAVPEDAPVVPESPEYHEAKPEDAPSVPELPEFHQEIPSDAPVVPELPEFVQEVPSDSPVNEVPELPFGVNPEDAPVVPELPEFSQAIPEDAPINDVPELAFGVNPEDAPIVPELPEFNQTIPEDSPINDVPELAFGVNPEDAPIVPESPEYHEATPTDAPINEVPELPFGINPEDAPVVPELPEFHQAIPDNAPSLDLEELPVGVNPEDAPVLELPELVIETPKEEQDVPGVPNEDKPVLPTQPVHILPQTGSTTSPLMALVGLGLMTLSLGGWFTLNKRK
jgi:LPXTG-motif cell wall-anchored protein